MLEGHSSIAVVKLVKRRVPNHNCGPFETNAGAAEGQQKKKNLREIISRTSRKRQQVEKSTTFQ
jgi:hypothetical protein